MSLFVNSDDTLLEGDLGDDIDYDLGNEDEDALLADDYDVAQTTTHRTVYLQDQQEVLGNQDGFRREPEEPLDDVLDLGVTEGDVLDDLDSELQETQEPMGGESIRREQKRHEPKPVVHNPNPVVHDPKPVVHDSKPVLRDYSHLNNSGLVVQQKSVDVTDASQISQETSFMEGEETGANQDAGAGMESEEEEDEAEESRGDRFKTERTTIVSLKDNVCVEDAKQVVRRDGGWKGRRGRRGGGGPRPHFGPGNTFGVQQQQLPPHQIQTQPQQFGGPRFGPGNPGFTRPVRGGLRGGHMYNQSQVNQQPLPPPPPPQQQPPQQQQLQQQQHQSPHKILINPHFRGAVQPHPEARLIWDTEMAGNSAQMPPQTPQGDGMVAFAPGIQTVDTQYQGMPQGGGYGAQQFQPPPHHQQIESHSLPSPQYDSSSQQGGYYPPEQTYSDPHSIQHWQDNCEPSQQVNAIYTQPSPIPMGVETNNMPVGHHESMFHHTSHAIGGDPGINHGQPGPGGVIYSGVVQYEGVPQQQEMFVEEGNYPPAVLPPQPHYHQQQPQPPPMSPGGHRLPPPMMGPYRMPGPPGVPGGMKFRQPNHGQFQGGSGYVNQGGRPRGGPRFNVGVQMNVPQQIIRPRRAPGPQIHMVQQQQLPPPQQLQSNRPPKKRPSFDSGAGPGSQFKQNRFDISTKRKKAGGRSVVATKSTAPQQQQQQELAPQQPALPRTKTVLIENLAASTSENQMKSLCQGIGTVESIQMLSKQRRAIIKFVNPTSAATFYKRYQRKIIDLSLIKVSLVP
ncbi:hypothetical protein C0J52_21995 [Blattella germanica]|nr:hypothetical protein C0J52_21995 [Blattella germanica]